MIERVLVSPVPRDEESYPRCTLCGAAGSTGVSSAAWIHDCPAVAKRVAELRGPAAVPEPETPTDEEVMEVLADPTFVTHELAYCRGDAPITPMIRRALEIARRTTAGLPHDLTPEHDADIAYYEREVRTARQGSLNPSEWPELEAEIARVQDVRRVINALAANPGFRVPPSPAQLAMYDTSDEAGE